MEIDLPQQVQRLGPKTVGATKTPGSPVRPLENTENGQKHRWMSPFWAFRKNRSVFRRKTLRKVGPGTLSERYTPRKPSWKWMAPPGFHGSSFWGHPLPCGTRCGAHVCCKRVLRTRSCPVPGMGWIGTPRFDPEHGLRSNCLGTGWHVDSMCQSGSFTAPVLIPTQAPVCSDGPDQRMPRSFQPLTSTNHPYHWVNLDSVSGSC